MAAPRTTACSARYNNVISARVATQRSRRYVREHLLVGLTVMLLTALISLSAGGARLDRVVFDQLVTRLPAGSPPAVDITLVEIDPASLGQVGPWPWSRRTYASLVDQLTDSGARVVVLDLLLDQPDLLDPEADQALQQALAAHGRVYLPVHLQPQGEWTEVIPYGPFARAARGLGHADVQVDEDGVVRRLHLRAGMGQAWWPHLALVALNEVNPRAGRAFPMSRAEAAAPLQVVAEYPRLIPFAPPGRFIQVSAAEVLAGRVPAEKLQGRYVLVGVTADEVGDRMPVAISAPGATLSGVALNAHILHALLGDGLIVPLSAGAALGWALLLVLPLPLLLPLLSPGRGVLLVLVGLVLQLGCVYLLMAYGRVWLAPSPVLIGTLATWPLWTWRRLDATLGYLRQAVSQLISKSDINRRLAMPASVEQLERFAEQVLPLEGWRLERDGEQVSLQGRAGVTNSWQGAQVRHREFVRDGHHYLFSVCFEPGVTITPEYERWLDDMVSRTCEARLKPARLYNAIEQHVAQVEREEQRQQSLTHFLDATFTQMQDGFLLADACGVVLMVNQQAGNLLCLEQDISAFSRLDLVASYLSLPEAYPQWMDVIRKVVETGQCRFESRNCKGEDLDLDLRTLQVGDFPGRVFSLVIRDVSTIKEVMRSRTEMIDFLSHDLRSPMISLLALVERMRHEPGDLPRFLDNIEEYTHRSLNISEQFLQLARVEALQDIGMEPLDMLPVVESAIEQVAPQAQDKNIALRFHDHSDEAVWVQGNHELLERLVVNLLTNAVKYSEAGQAVDISLLLQGEHVVCEVRDQGMGIPEANQASVFERYTRAATGEAARLRGAGLGLRFVKVVANRHGGDVQLESQEGEGSRFVLTLPRIHLEAVSGARA